jgi:ribonuclease BN (tRNA processing enzyme)
MKAMTADKAMPALVVTAMRAHMERQHISLEQVGLMAQKAGVKTVVLTHFAPGLDGEPDDDRYAKVVRKHFSGTVVSGHDLGEY